MNSSSDWRKTHEGALARAEHLLASGQWSDCRFLVGEPSSQELVMAHKLPLISASPVFETMFHGSIPAENEPIEVPDIQAGAFKAMLKFVYTDDVPLVDSDLSLDLYYCARKYMLPSLAAKCKNHLQSNISPQNVCRIYELAELFGETKLLEKCLNFMRTETKKILTDSSWLAANRTTVSALFEEKHLAIDSELELYDALLLWSTAECQRKSLAVDKKSLRSVSGDLLGKIRFLAMDATEIANGPGKAEILEKDEILAILMNKVSDNSGISIPEGFSFEKIRRFRLPDSQQTPTSMIQHTPNGVSNFFCYRPFIQDGTLSKPKLCRTHFQVTKNIEILGVLVSTQLNSLPEDRFGSYIEHLRVKLYDDYTHKPSTSECRGAMSYNSIVQIIFDHPLFVAPLKIYKIQIEFYSSGKYPNGRVATSATSEQVTFTLGARDYSYYNTNESLLRGIVFAKTK